MKSTFEGYHPAVSFVYFACILIFSMTLMHPAALALSILGSLCWTARLKGAGAMRRSLLFTLPMLGLAAFLNPAFNHEGATILAYLPSGNPLTLESILYGLAAAAMLAAVLCWFGCFNLVMTSDKLVYLFGRVIPALSLVLSMTLRFVPRFSRQLRAVLNAQRAAGRDMSAGPLISRARQGVRILSIMITWSLENAIDTADSMKSRGYGLKGRTAFAVFRWGERDRAAMAAILGLACYTASMAAAKGLYCSYFPTFRIAPWDAWSASGLLAYAALCAAPMIIDIAEDRRWRGMGREAGR